MLGDEEAADLLCELVCRWPSCKSKQLTALHVACWFNIENIVGVLAPKGNLAPHVIPYRTIGTPLHLACKLQRRGIAKILLDSGAKTCEEDALGRTPLHIACQVGAHDLVA